jgi:hypothetical protein
MKQLTFTMALIFFIIFAMGCDELCCKCRTAKAKSSPVPMVFKDEPYKVSVQDEPLVLVDQPAQKTVEPTYVEETVEEVVSDYDTCVEQCNADNVSRSLINFCIREKCK